MAEEMISYQERLKNFKDATSLHKTTFEKSADIQLKKIKNELSIISSNYHRISKKNKEICARDNSYESLYRIEKDACDIYKGSYEAMLNRVNMSENKLKLLKEVFNGR